MNQMCVDGTPLEHYPELGLWVKHEELCCPPGPHFSKTRGVYAHIKARPERMIGVLDTYHSQGGWAVAQACKLLGKQCYNYYPVRKAERDGKLKPQQVAAEDLGAVLIPLQAGRSAVIYHQAKKHLAEEHIATYMMPNALKLPEMITETVAEVRRTFPGQTNVLPGTVIVSASSGTIAAGVLAGLVSVGWKGRFVVHQGYSRSASAIQSYMQLMSGLHSDGPDRLETKGIKLVLVDEGYAYGDEAKAGPLPPFPCNVFYDLKAFRWWMRLGREMYTEALLWNIG